jgi:hypothetical protein
MCVLAVARFPSDARQSPERSEVVCRQYPVLYSCWLGYGTGDNVGFAETRQTGAWSKIRVGVRKRFFYCRVAVNPEARFISVGFELVGFLRQGKTIHSNQLRQTTAGLCVSEDLGT